MEINEVNVVYFSPTRTSKKIAESVAAGLGYKKINVYDATKAEIEFEAVPDSITVVAVPVYGGHVALTARSRIQGIKSEGAPVVPLVVYGNRAYEEALNELSDMLENRGFVTVAAATFVGEHSYSTETEPIAQGRPDRDDIDIAVDFGRAISGKLFNIDSAYKGRVNVRKIKKPSQALLPMLGFIYNVIKLRNSTKPMPQTPFTDKELCSHCGLCVKVCPVGAIEKGREEITNASSCIRCCACVKKCPHRARTFDTPFAELLARFFKARKRNCTLI